MCHGALTVPNGVVPGDGEVDFERPKGHDCVSASLLEVLTENVQGPGCKFLSTLGPVVNCYVSLAMLMQCPVLRDLLCSKKKY